MNGTERPLEGARVMVVEDEYYLAVELRRLVTQLGGDVVGPAKDVDEALRLLNRDAWPDLAILDVNLDGARVNPLAAVLRARGVPLLFATGYEASALDSCFYEDPVVFKPVTIAALAMAIRKLRHRRNGNSA